MQIMSQTASKIIATNLVGLDIKFWRLVRQSSGPTVKTKKEKWSLKTSPTACYEEALMQHYSYGRSAATSLYKKVVNKHWASESTRSATEMCRVISCMVATRPVIPTKLEMHNYRESRFFWRNPPTNRKSLTWAAESNPTLRSLESRSSWGDVLTRIESLWRPWIQCPTRNQDSPTNHSLAVEWDNIIVYVYDCCSKKRLNSTTTLTRVAWSV